MDAHAAWQWALGHERGVLTHLNQCVRDVQWAAADGLSMPSINERLAGRVILKPRETWPATDVLRLLGGDPEGFFRRKRAHGQAWKENRAFMQAQAGNETVILPVRRLLDLERLEGRHQASILLLYLPAAEASWRAPGLPPRWIPRELLLDLAGIEAVTPEFADALIAEVAALGVERLLLRDAVQEVAGQLLK